jgi:hypothetical protein
VTISKSKPMVRTKLIAVDTATNTGQVIRDEVSTISYGPFIHLPMPTKLGVTTTYLVEVEYMGEKQYKRPYANNFCSRWQVVLVCGCHSW